MVCNRLQLVMALAVVGIAACGTDTRGRIGGRSDAGEVIGGGGGDVDLGDIPVPIVDDGGMVSCPPGTRPQGGLCVTEEIVCGPEFPCPAMEECVGGRCVSKPGPCVTNDDCPVGFQCIDGTCQNDCPPNPACKVDADCGANEFCIACNCVPLNDCARPTADVAGNPWTVNQILNLREALTGFQQSFVAIMKKLRDGILNCPPGSSNDCWLYKLISLAMPQWAKNLVVIVGNFGEILDNDQFRIQSTMTFKKNGKPSGYDGVDNWKLVSFTYMNKLVQQAPDKIPQIGKPVFVNFTASAVCGVLYVDKHKVEGVLSGILRWILDTVVELTTCGNGGPCYKNLGDAIDASIDCNQVDPAAKLICIGFKTGLKGKINQAIDSWLLDYSLMTLKGTATVNANGRALENGKWDGTLGNGNNIFKNFTGTWTGKR